MQDQKITLETAKLAKQKDFNEACDSAYNGEGKLYFLNSLLNSMTLNYCAPTQTLLQRWLRDTHQLHVETTIEGRDNICWWEFSIYDISNHSIKYRKCDFATSKWDTFEIAMEIGLQSALNLIQP